MFFEEFLIYIIKKFFPIIKNFENDWENTWYSFFVMADSWWFLYSTNHAVEDTFKVCPTCTWVLVTKGRNPFFGYRTPTDDQKLNGLLLFQFLLILIYFFMDMYKTFYPSWRPIIPWYIFFEDEGLFPLITKR